MEIGDYVYAGKRTGRVASVREGWVWVRWYRDDGLRGPEVLYRRVAP
jgi:hypothetical protein